MRLEDIQVRDRFKFVHINYPERYFFFTIESIGKNIVYRIDDVGTWGSDHVIVGALRAYTRGGVEKILANKFKVRWVQLNRIIDPTFGVFD